MIPLDKKEEIYNSILKKCGQYSTHVIMKSNYLSLWDVVKNNCQNIVHFDIDIKLDAEISQAEIFETITSMPKLKYLKIVLGLVNERSPEYINIYNEILEVLPEIIEENPFVEIIFCPKNKFANTTG